MIILIILILILTILDILQTKEALKLGYREKNPVARWLFGRLGFAMVTFGKVILALGISILAYLSGLWLALVIFVIICLLPIVNNLIVLRRIKCY